MTVLLTTIMTAEAEIKAIVNDIDTDGRGVIDYKEFERIMQRDIKEYDNEQDLKNAWKVRTCRLLVVSMLSSCMPPNSQGCCGIQCMPG